MLTQTEKTLDLRKKQVLDLKKSIGIDGQKAQVVFCLDFSGSMSNRYRNGEVQDLLERIAPIAMAFDDNQSMEVYLFSDRSAFKNGCLKVSEDVIPTNLHDYIKRATKNQNMSGTEYAPPIAHIVSDYCGDMTPPSTGGFFSSVKEALTPSKYVKKKLAEPVYVIFITDGQNSDRAATVEAMVKASHAPVFFQFVGIGDDNLDFLEKLDTMPGRFIDNANFFQVENINKMTDDELYKLLLAEFPSYLKLAASKGLL